MSAISAEHAPPSNGFTADDIIKAVLAPRARLDVWSHGVRISHFGAEVRSLMIELCRLEWGEFGTVRVDRFRSEKRIKRVYVGTTKDRSAFHFHRNQLDFVLNRLMKIGIGPEKLAITYHEMYEPVKVKHPLHDERPPREKQVPIISYINAPCDARYAPSKVVTLQTGGGKATTLDTQIKIPGGWTTMGEIKLGDTVTAKDGTPTQVTGVYPQGKLQVYRVTFGDGRSVEVCGEHLWKVYYVNTQPHKRWRVVNTLEVLRLISMPNPRVYVDLVDPEVGVDINLPIDPYVLGALIGDGHLGNGSVSITNPDPFIIDQLTAALPDMKVELASRIQYYIRPAVKGAGNWVMKRLIDLGLYGKLANRKFIPEVYFQASAEQKWALLQGLMDTDGYVDTKSTTTYTTVSPELAANVQYLVRELGGIASITEKKTQYTYLGKKLDGQLAYNIHIRMKTPSKMFRLPRKKERANDDHQYCKDLKLRVVSVEPTEVKPAQCISVDHPDRLFVVNDFIVTHNTFLSLTAIRNEQVRVAIILKGMYVDKWIGDIEGAYGAEKGALMVIRGIPQLRAALEMARLGALKARVIVFSQKTMFMYLQYYEKHGVDEFISVSPMDLYKHLGVGLRLIDEVHQEFHCNFRQDLYTHIPKTLSLSATLEPDQKFIEDMYRIVWPVGTWAPEMEYDRFIAVKALWYRISEPGRLRWLNFLRQYNHTEYEKSIFKRPQVLENYTDMILDIVERAFMEKKEKGQKMMIFVATVQMATLLADMLATKYPKELVNRYVSEDEYEDLVAADISVTTLQSAGTAVDVPNLRITLMTTALSSKQSNIQVLGRTRRLIGWPDVTPEFYFLSARDIDKHVQYTKEKKVKLEGKVLSFQELGTNYVI
ncbi:putative DNA helicase [Xanthomonas phage RTH11]|nr:putative DNA helicase [Xanthomonas phage RTH11]